MGSQTGEETLYVYNGAAGSATVRLDTSGSLALLSFQPAQPVAAYPGIAWEKAVDAVESLRLMPSIRPFTIA